MSGTGAPAAGGLRLRPAAARGHVLTGGVRAVEAFSRADAIDPEWMGWGALRVLSHQDWAPAAIREEGRIANMERLLLVADGTLDADCGGLGRHRVDAGAALWIGAGHGIEVRLANASPTAPLRLVDIWLQPDRVNAAPAVAPGGSATGRARSCANPGGWELVARGASQPAGPSTSDDALAGDAAALEDPTAAEATGAPVPVPLRQRARVSVGRPVPGERLGIPADGQRFWLDVLEGEVVVATHAGEAIALGAGDGLGWLAGDAAAPAGVLGAGDAPASILLVALPA